MNPKTQKVLCDYAPELVVAIYASRADGYPEYYLEAHQVGSSGEILEGKPLQQETLADIVAAFYNESKERAKSSGLIPTNMLHIGEANNGKQKLVWWRPGEIVTMHFVPALNLPTGRAWVPPTVWQAEGGSLQIYAMAADARPELGTRLYQAPFYNTAENGDVCLGSAKMAKPNGTYEGIIDYWHGMFYKSIFTHGESRTKSPMNILWQRLLADNTLKWSDIDELVESSYQLKDIIR